jgi:hypothetical protein
VAGALCDLRASVISLFGRISDRRFEQTTACLLALAGFAMIV